jgi:hypothetical protein
LRCAAALAFVLVLASSAPALAEDDGAFGRLDGDLLLQLGAGPAFGTGGPALGVDVALLYLGSAGVYAYYTDALGSDAPHVERSIAVGAELRPLFLGRYAKDMETGPPRLDLFVDSLAIGLGAVWDAPHDAGLARHPGLELALSLDFPFFEDATGPFIGVRGALRWRAVDLSGEGEGDILDRGAFVALTVAWHHVFGAHAVDAFDRNLE